jgi:GT2 family glycosyltransferase
LDETRSVNNARDKVGPDYALGISAIVPTIGRPQSLRRLLESLATQTYRIDEVIVADGSSDGQTAAVIVDPRWAQAGLAVRRISVSPPHAVRQREAAIAIASGDLLLLLDDDVQLERECVAMMLQALDTDQAAVAVMADFNNQSWPMPTQVWRLYLRFAHGLGDGEWQGRVIGPLLRYGFHPPPMETKRCEWLGSGNSLISREAFERSGGFSDFFRRRSTVNEDVDLSLRLARQGHILFCPRARLGHFQDPRGRVSPQEAAEDDLVNRFHALHQSAGRSRSAALYLVAIFTLIESASNLGGALRRGRWGLTGQLLRGRVAALWYVTRLMVGRREDNGSVTRK